MELLIYKSMHVWTNLKQNLNFCQKLINSNKYLRKSNEYRKNLKLEVSWHGAHVFPCKITNQRICQHCTNKGQQLLTCKFGGVLDRYSILSETVEPGRKIKQKKSWGQFLCFSFNSFAISTVSPNFFKKTKERVDWQHHETWPVNSVIWISPYHCHCSKKSPKKIMKTYWLHLSPSSNDLRNNRNMQILF